MVKETFAWYLQTIRFICLEADKSKLQKIIKYLNNIPLVKASKDEMPTSPDVTIVFIGSNDKTVGSVWIYGEVFIEDRLNQKLYRGRKILFKVLKKFNFNDVKLQKSKW